MKIPSLKSILICLYEAIYPKAQHIVHMLRIRLFYRLRIMSSQRTLRYIKKTSCSIARYGDGEFSQMIYDYNIGFQEHSDTLAHKLRETLTARNNDLLICIPKYLVSVRKCNKNAHDFWLNWGKKNNQQVRVTKLLRQCCGKRYLYGDSLITRPYMDLKSKKHAGQIFSLLKELWNGQDILIVEGSQTRLGIGNDLFSNARSIKRILAPAKNAFDSYEEILSATEKYCNGHLVLIALGPTATVLAADLSKKGIQALDVGHMDIEYEWFLQQATEKVKIQGKFSNELQKQVATEDCRDPLYLSQIVYSCQ